MSDAPYPAAPGGQRLPREEELRRALHATTGELRSFVLGFLDIADAIESWQEGAAGEMAKRLDLLRRMSTRLLILHGVRPTARPGQALDLTYHEVVSCAPDPTAAADTVVRVLQMGYEMGDLVLRPARVVVAAGPGAAEDAPAAAPATGSGPTGGADGA